MERVIKFRAKTFNEFNDNTKWVYGFLESISFIMQFNGRSTEVMSNTVGQFVYLTDRNGKEAYVGDIFKETLLNGEERFYKIFEVEGGFAINTFQDDFYKPSNQIQFWTALSDMQTISWFKSNLEEIGNIYENPELLSTDKTKTV